MLSCVVFRCAPEPPQSAHGWAMIEPWPLQWPHVLAIEKKPCWKRTCPEPRHCGQVFGVVPGALIWLAQIAWIPFWAAGVINGVGHYFGYRSYDVPDASTNIVPWGILIGGEELHNNHHAFASSAKLSTQWYEFDIGWMYICILESLGLAKVKRLAPTPRARRATRRTHRREARVPGRTRRRCRSPVRGRSR